MIDYSEPVVMYDFQVGERQLVPLPNKPSLAKIQELERAIALLPQTEMPPTHHFADGLYGREITIPAGTVLTGKMHRQDHLNFLMRGDITVWTEDGMRRIQAPAIIVSKPGAKRVGYAHTDTTWVTVHASKERDLAKLEAEVIMAETPALEHGEAA